MIPKLVLTDIDGVWTDGGMYYDGENSELKKFNTADSAGVLFCQLLDIPVGILTGENTPIVQRRADKLRIRYVYLGIKDKLGQANLLCKELNISLADVAYIGDDINDILLLQQVGFSAAPANAPTYVKKYAQHQLKKCGGEGAFREFVELLLTKSGHLDEAIEKYLSSLEGFRQ